MRRILLAIAFLFFVSNVYAAGAGKNLEATVNSAVDSVSNAISVIDYPHSETHDGSHFVTCDVVTPTGALGAAYYMLVTPNTSTYAHLALGVKGTKWIELRVYEAPTSSSSGTLITAYNRNRNSSATSTTLIYKNPVCSVSGESIYWQRYISNDVLVPNANTNEFVLKANTKYLVHIADVSGTANNPISTIFDWYEHANSN